MTALPPYHATPRTAAEKSAMLRALRRVKCTTPRHAALLWYSQLIGVCWLDNEINHCLGAHADENVVYN